MTRPSSVNLNLQVEQPDEKPVVASTGGGTKSVNISSEHA